MDRVWSWLWDRHGPRYSWAVTAVTAGILLPVFATSAVLIVAFEESGRYLEAAAVVMAVTLATSFVAVLPGSERWRPTERWAAGDRHGGRRVALATSYSFARTAILRTAIAFALGGWLQGVAVGAVCGAATGRLIQFGLTCAAVFTAVQLIAVHNYVEALLRPARVSIAGDSAVGDMLPRSRPSFATWSTVMVLATAWLFTAAGAWSGAVIDRTGQHPLLVVGIATGMTVFFAVPITVGTSVAPSLQPIRDLAEGTQRVSAGDYTRRLPVVQDDDLGALAASFNRMQAGLAERERLRAAFGSYVDPALATRLLDQGDDIFTGERREVTVVFVDIRDFTPFAEASTAEDTVSRLNALFEIVVPAVHDLGGHVNKYLGDGAMAVFGAPNDLVRHADAAVLAATQIQQRVAQRFGGSLRIGIGINTGQVVAGTIGGAGKLEFTLIGDTVNVAARIEQLTKATGDTILLTADTLAAMAVRPLRLNDRGHHDLKGKAATVHVYGLDGLAPSSASHKT